MVKSASIHEPPWRRLAWTSSMLWLDHFEDGTTVHSPGSADVSREEIATAAIEEQAVVETCASLSRWIEQAELLECDESGLYVLGRPGP